MELNCASDLTPRHIYIFDKYEHITLIRWIIPCQTMPHETSSPQILIEVSDAASDPICHPCCYFLPAAMGMVGMAISPYATSEEVHLQCAFISIICIIICMSSPGQKSSETRFVVVVVVRELKKCLYSIRNKINVQSWFLFKSKLTGHAEHPHQSPIGLPLSLHLCLPISPGCDKKRLWSIGKIWKIKWYHFHLKPGCDVFV